MSSYYDELCRKFFKELAKEKSIITEYVRSKHEDVVRYRVIPSSYFNLPSKEYAIVRGEEVMMECVFKSARAHVFTQLPRDIVMRVDEILRLDLSDVGNRSIFYCALNAVMRYYGLVDGTTHCRGNSPLKCAKTLVEDLKSFAPDARILLVGYQPAIAEELVRYFKTVYITDMSPRNIGKVVGKVSVLDHVRNNDLIREVDIVLATGSSLLNKTLWDLYEVSSRFNKVFILYGVSAAGASRILGIKRHCPLSQ
ncbi:MAG: Rossmann-like domain-containing protein [Thermoprotei archaeon]